MKNSEKVYFKDTSSFCDIVEFETPTGALRAEYLGSGLWLVYRDLGDAWLMSGAVQCGGKFSRTQSKCRRIHEEYMSIPDDSLKENDMTSEEKVQLKDIKFQENVFLEKSFYSRENAEAYIEDHMQAEVSSEVLDALIEYDPDVYDNGMIYQGADYKIREWDFK